MLRGDVFCDWIRAVAGCLPIQEGFPLACEALSYRLAPHEAWQVRSLVWFQSRRALDWIEANAPEKGITDQWGIVASVSELTWKDAEDWLSRGRPLRLIALDALTFCIDQRHVGEFKYVWPTLHDRPDDEMVKRTMRTTAKRMTRQESLQAVSSFQKFALVVIGRGRPGTGSKDRRELDRFADVPSMNIAGGRHMIRRRTEP